MGELLKGRPSSFPTNSHLEHVDHQDAELESVRAAPLVRVGACTARVPEIVGHEAREGRAGGDPDGCADVVGYDLRGKSSETG